MTTVKLDLDQLSASMGKMFRSYREAQKRGLVNAAMRGQSWIVSKLLPTLNPPPFDTGSFRAGWNFQVTNDGALIFNPVPHAPFIVFGVRPENVRVTGPMLEEWVVRKGIADEASAPRVAWLIAMSLRRKGIFTDPQFRILQRTVDEFLKDEVAKQVADELRKVGWKK